MSPDRRPEYSLHPEGLTPNQETLLSKVFDIGAVQIKPSTWKMHEKFPDAPLAPMYTDFRMLRSDAEIKGIATDVYVSLVLKGLSFDLIADVPTAITPVVSSVCDRLQVGQRTPRLDRKNYGSGRKIDGLKEGEDDGKTVVVVDDLINFGDSKREAIEILEEGGLVVSDIVVLLDYNFLNGELISRDGLKSYKIHSAFSVEQMLEFYLRIGKINRNQHQIAKTGIEELRSYVRAHPQVGSV